MNDMHFPFMRYKCCCMSRSRKTYAQYKCICIRIQFCSVATPSLEYRKNLERVFVSVFNDMESIYELCELFPSQIEGEVKCCINASIENWFPLGTMAKCRPSILTLLDPDTCSVMHMSYFCRPGTWSLVRSS